jgi:hypothetical protein
VNTVTGRHSKKAFAWCTVFSKKKRGDAELKTEGDRRRIKGRHFILPPVVDRDYDNETSDLHSNRKGTCRTLRSRG